MVLCKKSLSWQRLFILFAACLLLLLATACQAQNSVDFSYTEAAFSYTVTGELTLTPPSETSVGKIRGDTPIAFSAIVSSDVIASADDTKPRETAVTVTYTAPESLRGLQLTCRYHSGMTGEESVTLSYSSHTSPQTQTARYADVKSLLLPVVSLFPTGNVTSVSPTHDGQTSVTLQTADDPNLSVTYLFSEEYPYPISLSYQTPDRKMTLQISPVSEAPS